MKRQKTISSAVTISGPGLHTGHQVTVCLKPAAEDAGILFRRVDLPGQPEIRPGLENIAIDKSVARCTSLGGGEVQIRTVEHLMAALCGLEIDNLQIEIDGDELPGLDGSGVEFYNRLKTVGLVEQTAPRRYLEIREPLSVHNQGSSILLVPDDAFRVSYALNYDHPQLRSQFFTGTVNPQTFAEQIAPSRTFCLEGEAQELRASGLGKGANYENTLVVGQTGVLQNTVRFADEFVRHKVLDLVGDLYLLGRPLKGHAFAVRSGHTLNIEILKKVIAQEEQYRRRASLPRYDLGEHRELDIQQIMQILPHRYPFLLVDRVFELEKGKRAVGIKNVTINDNFFTGHFPSRPIMPGVLMVEAMAQVGGILVLTNGMHEGKVGLFMATDKVKFRKLVQPGDQLVMEVEVLRDRSRTSQLRGVARVAGEVVAEAEMMFSYLDAEFLV